MSRSFALAASIAGSRGQAEARAQRGAAGGVILYVDDDARVGGGPPPCVVTTAEELLDALACIANGCGS